jgi:ubiquitin carboxyl-terminal hydrolase 22/27/51
VSRTANLEDDSASNFATPSFLYDLIGSVNHFGTLQSGHYVANVLSGSKWYHCNDAHVSLSGNGDGSTEVAKSEGAYLLFYLRR